jgi:hypothetical protein
MLIKFFTSELDKYKTDSIDYYNTFKKIWTSTEMIFVKNTYNGKLHDLPILTEIEDSNFAITFDQIFEENYNWLYSSVNNYDKGLKDSVNIWLGKYPGNDDYVINYKCNLIPELIEFFNNCNYTGNEKEKENFKKLKDRCINKLKLFQKSYKCSYSFRKGYYYSGIL